jgi:hypothetical protein
MMMFVVVVAYAFFNDIYFATTIINDKWNSLFRILIFYKNIFKFVASLEALLNIPMHAYKEHIC